MNGKPGVLAVMGRLIGNTRTMAGLTGDPRMREHLREGEQARAAVERLLAADTQYDAAKAHRIEADNRIASGDRSDDAFRRQASASHAYDRAVDERRAALAAFRGEV